MLEVRALAAAKKPRLNQNRKQYNVTACAS